MLYIYKLNILFQFLQYIQLLVGMVWWNPLGYGVVDPFRVG